MPTVAIHRCKGSGAPLQKLGKSVAAVTNTIRRRAFENFLDRKGTRGSEVEDWLNAEADTLFSAPMEIAEGKTNLQARLSLAGFDPRYIELYALPDALVVEAEARNTTKQIFRRVDLPAPIDVDKVKASLDQGVLRVTAPKYDVRQMAATA